MASQEKVVLPVDWEYIDASHGFTFDVGNSVFKLLFVSPEDWVEPQDRKKGSKGCVRFRNFPLDRMEEGYQFVKDHVRTNRKSPDEVLDIYSSGAGGAKYGQAFRNELKVNKKNLPEFECFVHCLLFMLKTLPRKQLTFPLHRPAFEAARRQMAQWAALLPKMSGKSSAFDGMKNMDPEMVFPQEKDDLRTEEPITDEHLFPCGLAMCGTGFGFFMVNEDGTYSTVDNSHRGGKMFMGLGSLLTGAKTFEDLMELCTKGDAFNVSTTSKTWMKEQAAELQRAKVEDKCTEEQPPDEGDLYALMGQEMANMDEMLSFCFGQAQGKDLSDFKKEDLARCLLETMVTDLVQFTHSAAKRKGLRHIFFCCGFMSHPLVREITTDHWVQRDFGYSKQGEYIQAHFLTHGHAMGAIGAFINHKQRWSEKDK